MLLRMPIGRTTESERTCILCTSSDLPFQNWCLLRVTPLLLHMQERSWIIRHMVPCDVSGLKPIPCHGFSTSFNVEMGTRLLLLTTGKMPLQLRETRTKSVASTSVLSWRHVGNPA